MELDQTTLQKPASKFVNLHKVTPFSKYLAMALFVILPFLGGWVGYTFAPVKIIEVEKIVKTEPANSDDSAKAVSMTDELGTTTLWGNWSINNETKEILFRDKSYPIINSETVRNVGEPPCTGFIADDEFVYAVSQNSHPAGDQPEKLFVITDADPATFEADIAQSGNCYKAMVSKDGDNVFYGDKVVVGADPKTYKEDYPSELEEIDSSARKDNLVGETYLIEDFMQISQDKDSIFLRWEKLNAADQDTFEIIKAESRNDLFGTLVAQDTDNYYVDFCVFSKTGNMNQLNTILSSLSTEKTAKPFRMSTSGECLNTLGDYTFSLYPFTTLAE